MILCVVFYTVLTNFVRYRVNGFDMCVCLMKWFCVLTFVCVCVCVCDEIIMCFNIGVCVCVMKWFCVLTFVCVCV